MSGIMLASANKEIKKRLVDILAELQLPLNSFTEKSEELLTTFKTAKPEILILDLFMTGIYGLEVLKKLNEFSEECSVIVITSLRSPTIVEKLFRFGARDVLQMPFQNETLATTIRHRLDN